MANTRNEFPEKLINQWEKYRKEFLGYIALGNTILLTHNSIISKHGNPAKKINDIYPSENLINKLVSIQKDLIVYKRKFEQYKLILGDKYAEMDSQIAETKNIGVSLLIQINKTTADKYMYLKEGTSNKTTKKECVAKAYEHIQQAWKLYNENIDTLTASYDTSIEGYLRYIEDHYNSYFVKNASDSPIQDLIVSARNIRDKDAAFEKFQQAYDLAVETKNIERQFTILWEQARSYADRIYELNNAIVNKKTIQHAQTLTRKVCDAYIAAAKIKLAYSKQNSMMVMNSEGICDDLFRIAKYLSGLSTLKSIANEFELREALLTDAKEYQKWGDKLSRNIKIPFDTYKNLNEEIEIERQKVQSEKLRIMQDKIKKEKKEKLIARLQQEYDRKFEETLKKLNIHHQTSISTTASPISTSIPPSLEDEPELLDIPEEEELTPIYITFEWKQDKSSKKNIVNLAEHLSLLTAAETSNNLYEQVRAHTNISDYYRIEALHLLRQNWTKIPSAIEQLETAKEHLKTATRFIVQIKKLAIDTNAKVDLPLEDWVIIILQNTEKLLARTIKRQKNIEKRFDIIHDEAMNYIIFTYGPAAWFKDEPFDWEKLSLNAQIRLTAKANIKHLTQIDHDVNDMLDHLLIERLGNADTNKNSLPLCNNKTILPQVDQETRNQIKRAYLQNNLFSDGKLKYPLHRSQSFESYFDLTDYLLRDSNRREFGR